jgi:hypothetical protein
MVAFVKILHRLLSMVGLVIVACSMAFYITRPSHADEDLSKPMPIATIDEATRVAQTEVGRLSTEYKFQLIPDATHEYYFGWSFAYAPEAYIKSGNVNDLVPGNGPLVVERSGEVRFLTSSVPPDIALAEFEDDWQRRHPALRTLCKMVLHIAPGSRIMGFDFRVTSGRVSEMADVPAGWQIAIDNDPSWNAKIKGVAIVGAAALNALQLARLFKVEAAPPQSLSAGPLSMRGSVTVMKNGNLHMLPDQAMELVPALP